MNATVQANNKHTTFNIHLHNGNNMIKDNIKLIFQWLNQLASYEERSSHPEDYCSNYQQQTTREMRL
jgi:hypothetical protein